MTFIKKIFLKFLIVIRGFIWLVFGGNVKKFSKIWAAYKFGGLRFCWYRAVEKFSESNIKYDHKVNQLSREESESLINQSEKNPLISIVTPVYKVETKWLEKCIDSIVKQHYENWELILVDDASDSEDIKHTMTSKSKRDDRIKIFFKDQNSGIAGATNFGIEKAKGDFIGFLDHDDELTPDALTWIVWAINKHPEALWFYSDEDKVSVKEKYYGPHFKPDFSRECLLSNMFTCHFSVYSSEIIKEVNGLRLGFDGAQDHDLALRLSEIVPQNKVIHIPRVLYHWRAIPGSAAMFIEEKPKAPESGRKAVRDALERRNLKGIVTSNKICPTLYQIEFQPVTFPEVTIIIPTRNSLSLVEKCLNSLKTHTKYPNYNIIIIDNHSDDEKFLEYLRMEESQSAIKVIKYDKPFNHSEMNNIAVKSVNSDLIVFMNNDIEIISENWLEQLVAVVTIDDTIACTGCLLIYENMTVQHGGIILGLHGLAGHSHQYTYSLTPGYNCRLMAVQEMSAVTAALMILKKSAFESIGGFDSQRYPTLLNDVDLCLRFRKAGFRCLYNPMVKAYHYESRTRPIRAEEHKYREMFKMQYSELLQYDPFYNPNLSLNNLKFYGLRDFPVSEQIKKPAKYKEKSIQ